MNDCRVRLGFTQGYSGWKFASNTAAFLQGLDRARDTEDLTLLLMMMNECVTDMSEGLFGACEKRNSHCFLSESKVNSWFGSWIGCFGNCLSNDMR